MDKTKEKEPAPEATGTSSIKKDNVLYLNDSTYKSACQVAYKKTDVAIKAILSMYVGMSEAEQRAFVLGETYCSMLDALTELPVVVMKEDK